MADIELLVALEGRPIATLTRRDGEPEMTFAADYQQDMAATKLSVSLPRSSAQHHGEILRSWLWGLLPDNDDVLRRWAREYEASISSPSSLLATDIGMDCAGAVQFYRPDRDPAADRDSGVRWLRDSDVEERLAELRTDSTSWLGRRTAGQFSLAGAQAKTALRWDAGSKRWGVPRGHEPSTHIFKPAIPGLADQHLNEHLCLTAARHLGLTAATTGIAEFGDEQAVVVERFDRREEAPGRWSRIHQEDLCQALGVHPGLKYEADGGPTAADIADAIREATGPTVARREVRRFVDALIFNWIIGGTDAHAKNYALLHRGSQTRFAPLYDVSSILPYDDSNGHKIKLAMKVGDEYKIKRIGRKQWIRLAQNVGLSETWVLDRCEELATAAPAAFEEAAASYPELNRSSSMPADLTTLVRQVAHERLNSLR